MSAPELIGDQVPDWVQEWLQAHGGCAESREVVRAAAQRGVHARTLRRAAVALEARGRLQRAHHGSRQGKSVHWSVTGCTDPSAHAAPSGQPDPGPALCGVCGHAQSLHSLRGLNCTACPGRACTKAKT